MNLRIDLPDNLELLLKVYWFSVSCENEVSV